MSITRKYIIAISTVLFVSILSPAVQAQTSIECVPLKEDEKTRVGYFATIGLVEKKTLKSIHGIARLGGPQGQPLDDVFVEVFERRKTTGEPRRVAGCRTNENGRFEFRGIQKGKYLVRLSKEGGFQITDIELSLSPGSTRTNEIVAFLEVGH